MVKLTEICHRIHPHDKGFGWIGASLFLGAKMQPGDRSHSVRRVGIATLAPFRYFYGLMQDAGLVPSDATTKEGATMYTRTLTHLVLLVSLVLAAGAISAKASQTDTPVQRVRFVCQAFDYVGDHEFRNRVIILEQTSTTPLDAYPDLDQVDGSIFFDRNWTPPSYMGVSDSAEFRLRVYIATLISDDKTEEEIIEELLERPGDYRDSDSWFKVQDPGPMDYIGYGIRIDSTFYFIYERETDGFRKDFDLDLDEFYRGDVFDIDNLRDLDTDSLKRLDEMLEDEGSIVMYPSMITNAVSITLMEDGAYICRKPVLF